MEWRDEGIILGTRKHGETSAILEVMTRAHGRHLGLVRGGRSRKQQPVLQPGNRVDLLWRARLDEHLGTFQAEAIEMNAARLMDSAVAIYGLQTMAAHLRLLPERDAHDGLYETLAVMIAHLDDADAAGELVARFELLILDELGFGLDLSQCAATGARQDLAYVSPKSGRAVSRQAGAPWRDKMLVLPAFLQRGSGLRGDPAAIEDAFRLTGFFFTRHVYEPRGIEAPGARAGFLAALRKHQTAGKEIGTETAAGEIIT
ncbi:DNA repair protein RecO [Mesorhizobium escarrei]|uniref:DNA repair protein RecO n=1 Tax=Mesorhizobium escarrei TaxID=666018 RepID=A0ABM9EKN7_9HYPH|nr:DNA repair protein RecO [Mesorhizobium escarrei]CAH2409517.1 DNA repair protein RecO [Mesorhizobium escarrei]